MTEQLYRVSVTICNFLVMLRTMTLITMIMMMTRKIILILITIVNLLILDIAVIVSAAVLSHNNPFHIWLTPTSHDTQTSPNYTSTDIILIFTTTLVFLSSFRHKVLFLSLVHVLLFSFFILLNKQYLYELLYIPPN